MSIGKKHVVFHPYPIWSHNKALAVLAALILESRPDIIVTLLTDSIVYARFTKELSVKLNPHRYEAIISRIKLSAIRKRVSLLQLTSYNVIDVSGTGSNPMLGLPEFDSAFEALYNSKPLNCKSSGKTYDGLPRPILAVIDPFASSAIEAIRAVSSGKIPILAWMSAPSGVLLSVFGPRHLGGAAEPDDLETAASMAKAKEDLPNVAQKSAYKRNGVVHEVPGIPPMYDYEFIPQENPFPLNSVERRGQIYIRDTDGTICVSSSAFEKETIDATKQWYKSMGKTLFVMGPLSLPDAQVTVKESDLAVSSFLDRMQSRFGKKSLLYISFGTLFWPLREEKLWAFIEELIASQTPFVLAHASMFVNLSEDKKKLISDSGIGLASRWAPQEIILSHPVTGWFFTHGGWNSMQEAFTARVPLIFWPFGGDQPFNAARMVLHHRAGFELIEVRDSDSENDSRVPYRCKDGPRPTFTVEAVREETRSLMTRIKGDEGQEARQRFESVCDEMSKSWEDGHGSKQDLEMFLGKYFN